jgi:hypothetical protein
MPQTPEVLAAQLRAAIEPGARGRLVARGLARGIIWNNGELPPGTPSFSSRLTADLLDNGYLILGRALRLRDMRTDPELTVHAFRVAAESIEAAVRKGESERVDRGFHLVVAAAAFHLAHLAARSYCLVPEDTAGLNFSSSERVLVRLMRRDLRGLHETLRAWLEDEENTDEGVSARLAAEFQEDGEQVLEEGEGDPGYGLADAMATAVTRRLMQGIARFEYALRSGSAEEHAAAVAALHSAAEAAGEVRLVPLWWTATLARHLIDELWGHSLHVRIPRARGPEDGDFDALRERFIRVLTARGVAEVDLWPSQLEAARRAIDPFDDLAVALPTSAGKTRIAELCILRTLAAGRRVVYVTPLRALSAQLERTLTRTFRPLGVSVSSLYGAAGVTLEDVRTLESSQIVVATPEKLDFSMRQDPAVLDDVGLVVLDEGHMIGESTREVRYEVLVQRLLSRPDAGQRRIVCLSAVFGEGDTFEDFVSWLRSDEEGDPVSSSWRPTRQRSGVLSWTGNGALLTLEVDGETPYVPQFVRPLPPLGRRRLPYPKDAPELTVAAAQALVAGGHRVLVYCPQRGSVETLGKLCIKLHQQGYLGTLLHRPGAIARAERLASEWLGTEHVAAQALRLGIGVHHGGLPRPFLAEVERLLNDKVLPIVIASPTVAQGLDLSCSALVLHSIYRRGSLIEAKEYANVVGRAGRAYVDLDGLTIYPVLENTSEATRRKISEYTRLRREAMSRDLESGIVLVVRRITRLLSERLGGDTGRLLEYILNYEGDWDLPPSTDPFLDPEDAATEEAEYLGLVADLDTVLLSTVDDLACPVETLAGVLEEALRTSLWRRRLARAPQLEVELQQKVLQARAHWIWTRTTSAHRRACFTSGVGHVGGRFIDEHLEALLSALFRAEMRFLAGNIEAGVDALTGLAATLLEVAPFAAKKPDGWERLLSGWVRGTPTGELVGTAGGEEIGFIQDALVYRLVWAVETVRVHAQAHGDFRAELLAGLTPLVLTYGLPSHQACLLAQAGLASRTMIVRLLQAYPADFTSPDELALWLKGLAERLPPDFWPDAASAGLWRAFVQGPSGVAGSRWTETEAARRVRWDAAAEDLAPGSPVQLVRDGATGETVVYGPDLTRLGVVDEPVHDVRQGHTEAVVGAAGAGISIRYFGPRTAAEV